MESRPERIADRFQRLRDRVAREAGLCGRRPEEITIVGVSKTFPAAAVREAYHAGLRHVGENRVQELVAKRESLRELDLVWHMVGRLQTNKINKLAGRVDLLESLDRVPLARALEKRLSKDLDCLVEVKTTAEPAKGGVAPEDVAGFLDEMAGSPRIRIRGLMTVGPLTDDPEETRRAFRLLAGIFRRERGVARPGQDLRWLSMGMSEDFPIAIQEGANMIRIGRALFGPRGAPGP